MALYVNGLMQRQTKSIALVFYLPCATLEIFKPGLGGTCFSKGPDLGYAGCAGKGAGCRRPC